MKSGWTLGHEVGHNFGCAHGRGHSFIVNGAGYYTSMSMSRGEVGRLNPTVRFHGVIQYSNPDINFRGHYSFSDTTVDSGIPTGTVNNNNAASIKSNAKRVAASFN